MGQRVAAGIAGATLVVASGGQHNDVFLGEGWRYFDTIRTFIEDRP
jgi:hypothetical protein